MSPIFFCKHTRDKFRRELKRVRREVVQDSEKKRRDELKRQTEKEAK